MTVNMFVTPLNSSCSVVLGYNWLTCYNPSIDWVLGSIKFCPTPSLTSSAKKAQLPLQNSTILETLPIPATLNPSSMPLHIALIGAAAFALASKQPGVQSFRIHLSDPLFSTNQLLSLMRLLTFPMFQKSIMNLLMFLARQKPTH